MAFPCSKSTWHFLVQSQQSKHENTMWNLFKVNNGRQNGNFIDVVLLCLLLLLEFTNCTGVSMLTLNKQMPTGATYSQMFFKIIYLKNFVNFTGKHLCCSLFLIQRILWNASKNDKSSQVENNSACLIYSRTVN